MSIKGLTTEKGCFDCLKRSKCHSDVEDEELEVIRENPFDGQLYRTGCLCRTYERDPNTKVKVTFT